MQKIQARLAGRKFDLVSGELGDQGRRRDRQRLHVKRRHDRAAFEQVRVIAHLPELHQTVHDAHEVARRQDVLRLGLGDVLLVELALALGQAALDDVLVLPGELLLDVFLQTAQQEWPQDGMEAGDDGLVVLGRALDHARQRVGEPVLELRVGCEHLRHQEMHQRPQLHQIVLKGRARDQQPPLRVEVEEGLPPLRLPVLDHVGLVEDEVLPLLAPEHPRILKDERV